MAAPAVVGTASGGVNGSGNFTVTPPGGSAGYLAIAHWYGTDAELTPPSGWTVAEQGNFLAGDPTFCRYGLWIGSGGSAGSSWNHGNAHADGAAAVVVIGYDGAIAIHQSAGTDVLTSPYVSPAVTTTEAALIARLFFEENFPDPPTIGYPAGHPDGQIHKGQDAGSDSYNVAACHVLQSSPGSTGTASYTATGGSPYAARSMTVALTSTTAGPPAERDGSAVLAVPPVIPQARSAGRARASLAPPIPLLVWAGSEQLAAGIDLSVADAAHAQTGDSVTLTQTHVLAVQDATHTHTAAAVTFAPYATAASGDGRHIVDQNGDGYLGLFDTIWPMVQQAGRDSAGDWQADMDHWVDTRAGQGFNGLKFNLFGNVISGANADLLTFDDVSPFNTTNPATADPTLWNENYWERVDYLIDAAAAAGMTCWVHVCYKDDVAAPSGTGWLQGHSNGEYTSLGTILGNRYEDRPNIVWVYGGDYFDESAAQLELVADAVTAAGDTHLITVQNYSDTSGSAAFYTTSRRHSSGTTLVLGSAVATVEGLYTYGRVFEAAEQAYNTSPALPLVYYDGYYDGGDNTRLRRETGWALTSGVYSSHYGSESLWAQPSGWRDDLDAKPQLVNMLAVVADLPGWESLVPDFPDAFITAGKGTGTSTVTAAKTAGGTLAVVYNPVASNTVTLATAGMVAGYTARWVDPANGASVGTSTGTTFTRATANSAGGADWFLILEGPTGVTLTVADAAHGHTADAPNLTQSHTLTAGDAGQAHTVDSLTLTQAHVLAVQDSGQGQSVDSPALAQAHNLSSGDATQPQAADNVALTQVHQLAAADAVHGQTVDTPTLGLSLGLTVQDATQPHSGDSPALTQVHSLAVGDATQTQATDTPALTQAHVLAVGDAVQAQAGDSVTLAQIHTLTAQDAGQSQSVDSPTLTQIHSLSVQDAGQAQTADTVTPSLPGELAVSDAAQAHSADDVALTQVHQLAVQDAAQTQTADSITLVVGGITLVVGEAGHSHGADQVSLTQAHVLTVSDALHAHSAELVSLTQAHGLTVQDVLLSVAADNIVVTQGHVLVVAGAHHAQTADHVGVAFGGVGVDITVTVGELPARRWTGRLPTSGRLVGDFDPERWTGELTQ